MAERWRLMLVCEDRRTERFVRRLASRFGLELLKDGIKIAPGGKGSASNWVIKQYAHIVRERRSKNFQQRLAVVVVVDGDRVGVDQRMRELDQQLRDASVDCRRESESIALFVPTWSIESWIAHLCSCNGVTEDASIKVDPRFRDLWDLRESESLDTATNAWGRPGGLLRSLDRAYAEGRRIGMAAKDK